MADITIDLSPLERGLNQVNSNLQVINGKVNQIGSNLITVSNNLRATHKQTMAEMAALKKKLFEMQREQRFAAALQEALTEIIRVRQELESKFGAHKLVRDNMLGILQASDLGLIRESTISRCTEELMISAPKYWLAPCLIALAAWISNDEALANRALAEGLRRDREKTCLLFALITRRVNAGRIKRGQPATNTSFEWLAEYFKLQDPFRMRSSIIAYIDAYSNDVFGKDENNLCGEHIAHWMDILKKKNPAFAEEQKQYWLKVFNSYCTDQFSTRFKELRKVSGQFAQIERYLRRIDAAQRDSGIRKFLGDIVNAPVDLNKLTCDIDEQLVRLVSNYEEDEAKLRDEEQYLSYIKEFRGDRERAENMMNAIRARRVDEPVDFVHRLSASIFNNDSTPSSKITAVRLLNPYISDAFRDFITSCKDTYPKEIDLRIEESGKVMKGEAFVWTGKTENAENRKELVDDLAKQYESAKRANIAKITDEAAQKKVKIGKILTFCIIPAIIPVGPIMWYKGHQALKKNASDRERIADYYDKAKRENVELLNTALDERVQANEYVKTFQSENANETIQL